MIKTKIERICIRIKVYFEMFRKIFFEFMKKMYHNEHVEIST